MSKIYITSDLHFGHNKEFIYRARGFDTVEDMNEAFVKRWNEIVEDEDTVYVLGDLVMGTEDNIKYLKRLKGNINIILGNHDTANREAAYRALENVKSVSWAEMLNYKKYHFFLSHFPCATSNFDDDERPIAARTWNLCGHCHSTDPFTEMKKGISSYHIEVDAHNGYPVLLDDIIEDIKNYFIENKL